MAMINDVNYALQAVRLSALRYTDDPISPRLITLDPSFSLNPYINSAGLADIDRWPEIKRALDSPPPEYPSSYESARNIRAGRMSRDRSSDGAGQSNAPNRSGGLNYTQTIMGPYRSGGAGMRVTGRRTTGDGRSGNRANSTEALAPMVPTDARRPRSDSAPARGRLDLPPNPALGTGTSLRVGNLAAVSSEMVIPETAISISGTSNELESQPDEAGREDEPVSPIGAWDATEIGSKMATSGRPYQFAATALDAALGDPALLGRTLIDEGSDVEDEDIDDMDGNDGYSSRGDDRRAAQGGDRGSKRSSGLQPLEDIDFRSQPIKRISTSFHPSGLTFALNKYVPHLVTTSLPISSSPNDPSSPLPPTALNPFASLYTSVAAPPGVPSQCIELYFPHSDDPSKPLVVLVRNDATVEEVTGYGLYKYWEQGLEPSLDDEEDAGYRWSTVGWGLRIVEDDGEVDEDFPPLDRDSKISKFSYGQFAIVEATESQIKQNAAKQPHIQRRPSRIIAQPQHLSSAGGSRAPTAPPTGRPSMALQLPSHHTNTSDLEFSDSEQGHGHGHGTGAAAVGSYGFSSALGSGQGRQVLLRVHVTADADVRFTTTISVAADMYIADLTEILCRKKRLSLPASDWVLCLADYSLAIPLDRTVASLEGQTDLALVKRQWAEARGMRIGDRRGGDPNASISKRQSDVPGRMGIGEVVPLFKKYKVHRKIAIGRHERILAIDGDYIHIMPSENRAFFDSLKTTSFHISLVQSTKLSGRSGGFKINVLREGTVKRYEFEAENGRQAQEIVTTIQQLKGNEPIPSNGARSYRLLEPTLAVETMARIDESDRRKPYYYPRMAEMRMCSTHKAVSTTCAGFTRDSLKAHRHRRAMCQINLNPYKFTDGGIALGVADACQSTAPSCRERATAGGFSGLLSAMAMRGTQLIPEEVVGRPNSVILGRCHGA